MSTTKPNTKRQKSSNVSSNNLNTGKKTTGKKTTSKNTNSSKLNLAKGYEILDSIKLQDIIYNNNLELLKQFDSYEAKNTIIMYHLTSKQNAENILKHNFDISLSKRGASGKGINLSTDINHLKNYYNPKYSDYIIVCNVKFNKSKENNTQLNNKGEMKWILNKDGKKNHTQPIYTNPPKGFDALYVKGPKIYVIPNSKQVYPILIGKVIW